MDQIEQFFDETGWHIVKDAVSEPGTVSAIVPDLPNDDVVGRLESMVVPCKARVIWRTVELGKPPEFRERVVHLSYGEVDRQIERHILEPLIILIKEGRLVFFKDGSNEFFVLSGLPNAVECILGRSINVLRSELEQYAQQLSPSGQTTFAELSKLYMRE